MDIISKKVANGFYYAYHEGRFWRWDEGRKVWKESHLMARKYDLNREYDKLLTPETFLSDPTLFIRQGDAVRLPDTMMKALQAAQPCQNAPIDPVEEPLETLPDTPAATEVAEQFGNAPAAPSFDFSALGDLSEQATEADRQFDLHYGTAQDEYLISCIYLAKVHELTAKAGRYGGGTWTKWYESKGLSEGSARTMVKNGDAFKSATVAELKQLPELTRKDLSLIARNGCARQLTEAAGDSQQVQELLAQLKAEKERAAAAESREEEAWNMVSKAQGEAKAKEDELVKAREDVAHLNDVNDQLILKNRAIGEERESYKKSLRQAEERAATAKGQLDAATANVNGLYEENSRLNAEKEQALQRAAKAEEALKHQPITAVVDEEEVDRRAAEKAWGLADARNAELQEDIEDLKQQLAKAKATPPADLIADKETADGCVINIEGVWSMALPAFSRLVGTGDTLNNVAERLITLCGRIHAQAVQLIIKNDKESQDE